MGGGNPGAVAMSGADVTSGMGAESQGGSVDAGNGDGGTRQLGLPARYTEFGAGTRPA
jgi:hypothetical protein